MAQTLSVSVAQTCPVRGDVNANIGEHSRLAELAASEGARVVVFPELSLTGYEIALAEKLAFSEQDSRLAPLVEAASSFSITIIAGAPVRLGERLYIGAFVLNPETTTTLYTKHHLGAFDESARRYGIVPPAEATVFHPGDRNPLVRLDGCLAAVAVCADVGRASHSMQAAERGADAYLASVFVIPSGFASDAARLERYAARYSMVAALANFGSASGGLASAGQSSIWSETGELLVRLGPSGSGIAIATRTPAGWHAKSVMLDSQTV